MNFWDDGFDLVDLEKIILCFCFVLVVIVAAIKYFVVGDISANWTNVIFIIGGLFTVRKAVSYFKKDTYNNNLTFQDLDYRYSTVDKEGGV